MNYFTSIMLPATEQGVLCADTISRDTIEDCDTRIGGCFLEVKAHPDEASDDLIIHVQIPNPTEGAAPTECIAIAEFVIRDRELFIFTDMLSQDSKEKLRGVAEHMIDALVADIENRERSDAEISFLELEIT